MLYTVNIAESTNFIEIKHQMNVWLHTNKGQCNKKFVVVVLATCYWLFQDVENALLNCSCCTAKKCLNQRWQTCGPRAACGPQSRRDQQSLASRNSGVLATVDEQFFSFLRGFIVWLKSCAARLLSGNWQSGPW